MTSLNDSNESANAELYGDDLLTVIETENPCNKRVSLSRGEITKKPASVIYEGTAVTARVPDLNTMYHLLHFVAESPNRVLVQGYPDGCVVDEPYRIISKKQLGDGYTSGWVEHEGQRAIARLKANFRPSSWAQLDRDIAPGLPQPLAALSDGEYFEKMALLAPGFDQVGYVKVNSTSSRVLLDGKPIEASGCRYWFQLKDASDTDLGRKLIARALLNGLAFRKVNKIGASTWWSIFDPTVFSPERVVYDGQPSIGRNKRLSLAAPSIELVEGGRLDSAQCTMPEGSEVRKIERDYKLSFSKRSGTLQQIDKDNLTLETHIPTKTHGVISIREYMDLSPGKLRCQAVFRDSDSWNGFIDLDYQGLPVLFDNGTRTRYELNMQDQIKTLSEVFSNEQ